MEYQSGQVVYSKSGHDKGDTLMVLFVEGAYVYLACLLYTSDAADD